MYHRNGQVKQFQNVLSEALKDPQVDLEVSNGHMFENKNKHCSNLQEQADAHLAYQSLQIHASGKKIQKKRL